MILKKVQLVIVNLNPFPSNNIPIQDMYIPTKFHCNRTKNKEVIADFQKSRKRLQENPYGS